ncbi:hypothetical protein V496_08120 [Pseudogymnoascus sp. VKM F-4515 (FW-2607)]|nr:hypothetical protein V496_08120 [Pseudogymnoascus sp. VKM F-4515 (FW-2607)]KFY95194.1 hypothetical protein V498_03492 [Pseudogymnoascus sp. VKM F-4517 (FW-2822)]
MGRETGHLRDSLYDEGDGTLSVAGPHDMRASDGAEQSLNQHEQPDIKRDLDQAVRAGLETYEAAKKMGPSGDEYGEQRADENCGGYL